MSTPRILVVDDEKNIQRAMKWELKGFDIVTVSCLDDALAALCESSFDAVVCDWNLGASETGERVLQMARAVNGKARRFIVSGQVPDSLGALILSGIAHRYIAKPWSPHDVRDAMVEELHC